MSDFDDKVAKECQLMAEMVVVDEKIKNPTWSERDLYLIRLGANMGAQLAVGLDNTALGFDKTRELALNKE
jgi:hypothetical protein